MRAALLEHDEVLRDAIESHGGFLFSHTGDGVVAAFASPRSAVDAAVGALLVPMDTTMIGATDDQSHRRKV